MNNQNFKIIALGVFFLATVGMMYHVTSTNTELRNINVQIEETNDGTWRVRDINGTNKGRMNVNRKDKIAWQAKGSEMIFTFSENVDKYFDYEEGLFEDGKSQRIDRSKKLRVTLKDGAPQDTLVYEVYVTEADTFVVGNSPPVLIIQ